MIEHIVRLLALALIVVLGVYIGYVILAQTLAR